MRTRLLVACVAVTASLGCVAGCGSGSGGRAQAARPSSVRSSASAAPSVAQRDNGPYAPLMRRLAGWSDDHRSVTATESTDFDGHKFRFDGLFTWDAQPAMDVRVPTAQLSLQRLQSADKTEVLLVGGSYYYRVASASSGPLKGRHWMRAPQPQPTDGSAVAAHGLQPENALRMLPDATGWTDMGTADVDGTSGKHYQGTVTRAALSADSRLVKAAGVAPATLLAGADSAELDVWVDAHGKPVRWVEMSTVGRSFAIDFFDFGGPRTVHSPAAGDTVDAAKVPGRPSTL